MPWPWSEPIPSNRTLLGAIEWWGEKLSKELSVLSKSLLSQGAKIMAHLDAVTAEVKRNSEVIASAVIAFKGLADKIEELKTDPVALQALVDELRTNSTALADAVAVNTPAE